MLERKLSDSKPTQDVASFIAKYEQELRKFNEKSDSQIIADTLQSIDAYKKNPDLLKLVLSIKDFSFSAKKSNLLKNKVN